MLLKGKEVLGSACLVLALSACPAWSETISLMADLSPEYQVPPADSNATGSAELSFDTDTNVLEWTIDYSGLSAAPTAAHFHGPAAPGENASPLVTILGNLASPIEGSETFTPEDAEALLSDLLYINIHTAAFPGGELRGQVVRAN
jgi:CHRD domain